MQSNIKSVPARPPLWLKMSIVSGNLLQLGGLLLGALLLISDAHSQAPALLRVIWMIVGWLLIYICCHASAHWLVGRLVGIRFQAYGMRGSDHPQDYPAGARQFMTVFPTFTAMTDKTSMKTASPAAKAMMFAAGESSTAICSILVGWYAWQSGIPGGFVFFVVMVIFNLFATLVTAIKPRGDYAKARSALKEAHKTS